MKLSVIIPYFNDHEVLSKTIPFLIDEIEGKEVEIIIIDNGSHESLVVDGWPQVKVVWNSTNAGVGGAFNQGTQLFARSDRLVFMGADVIPAEGWVDRVIQTLDDSTDTIFSCTSTEFVYDRKDDKIIHVDGKRRYGARIQMKIDRDDLPPDHRDRQFPKYHRILQAQWNYQRADGDFTRVGCMLGAFYWMRKQDFIKLRGWNGHKAWGSLEPFLSIKARAHGMRILVDNKLEAAHYFGRKINRGSRPDIQYYNMIFMAKTMFSEALEEELIDYLLCGNGTEDLGRLNVKQALKMIKRHAGLIHTERNYNNKFFRHGLISNWQKFQEEMI
jgi:GT2 family glycosyltransferase